MREKRKEKGEGRKLGKKKGAGWPPEVAWKMLRNQRDAGEKIAMVRWIAGIIVLLALVASPLLIGDAQQRAPVQRGPTLVAPGTSLAGINLGDSITLILARFGTPSEVRVAGQDQLYVLWRYGIIVYVRGGIATGISTTNSLLRTVEDIGAGSRLEEVTAAYGTNSVNTTIEGFRGIAYPHLGIAFGLENQTVVVVYVFRPQAAASPGTGETPAATTKTSTGSERAAAAPIAYPNVAGLRPFSPETMNLSLAGYLRLLMYQQTGLWISYPEAIRIVKEQLAAR